MPYPIRFKVVHKDTGESFKDWAKRTGESDAGRRLGSPKVGLMPFLNEQGNIGFVDFEGFYLGQQFLSPAEWKLLVATEKDDKGQWVYEQMGF